MSRLRWKRRRSAPPAAAEAPRRLGLGGGEVTEGAEAAEAVVDEPSEQAGWTHGSNLASRVVSALFAAALLAGPTALVLHLMQSAPAPAQAGASAAADADMSARRAAAEDVATRWVNVWLSTPADRRAELAEFYAGDVVLPQDVTAQVLSVRPVSAQATAPGVWSVQVGADVVVGQQLLRRYYQVPVSVDGDAAAASAQVMAVPAVVAGPGRQAPSRGLSYSHPVAGSSPLHATVDVFFQGWLTGQGDYTRVLSPGTDLPAPAAGFASVTTRVVRASDAVDVDTPEEGAQARLVVDVLLYDHTPTPAEEDAAAETEPGPDSAETSPTEVSGIGAQYHLSLIARAGRWEISAIDPSPTN